MSQEIAITTIAGIARRAGSVGRVSGLDFSTNDYLGLRNHGYPNFERHNARPRSPMRPAVQAELSSYFEPYDMQLTRWLGKVPSWRR